MNEAGTFEPEAATAEASAPSGGGLVNVAAHLPRMAALHPDRPAILFPRGRQRDGVVRYDSLSFRELDEESDRYAHGFEAAGIIRGMRTVLMVRPSLEFFSLTFALYKIGAVPVLIDPGMGMKRMAACLRDVSAEAFVGISLAHVFRLLNRSAFSTVRIVVTVGRRWFWGGSRLRDLRVDPWRKYDMAETRADEPAAIIFTTGSTGPPKGVLYLHGMFDAQVRILRDYYRIEPGEIDLPTFPLFALFDPALGMTAVIPDMDPTRPALVDPEKIIAAIQEQNVNHMFGSPALLNRVGRYGEARNTKLPSLRRIISAGAPVPPTTLHRYTKMLSPDAEIFTPYGATESLPVASIGSKEILTETRYESERGGGTCVGRPIPGIEVRVIRITDEPIETWADDLMVPQGEIGEIVVKGPVVTREYCTSVEATRAAKIRDGEAVRHRMGDVGRFDEKGRLWFCGRKAHRVVTRHGTLFTVPCEAIFNNHPRVFRSALVGVGERPNQTPVMCVELEPGEPREGDANLTRELLGLARGNELTARIETILYHSAFPVDIRHNSKIFREKLTLWAAGRVR